ncbi:Inner membrane protein YciS [Serratia symbiotica]|nr:Inner membrane protein YciS [Serratia symbiotica]
MKYLIFFFSTLVICILVIILTINNNQIINFNYLISQGNYNISILLGILFGSGFIFGWIIFSLYYIRNYIELRKAKHKIKKLKLQIKLLSKSTI